MNSVQIHLAVTHVPVILSLTGLGMLIVALLRKNSTLIKTSYLLIVIAGVAALPVFFTGEGTEEAVEHAPGISGSIIERHEEVATLAMISIAVAGVLALGAMLSFRRMVAARTLRVLVLLSTIASGGLMAQTAHLGGQISHTEIRKGVVSQNEKEAAAQNQSEGKNDQRQEQDHD